MLRSILPAVLAVSLVTASSTALAAEPGPFAPILQKAIDQHIVSGAVCLVADKDHVLDLEAVGLASLRTKAPMQTGSLFYIASMTKSFTATAVMMLVDEGKLTLDDPVEKYLPEFKGQIVAEKGQPPHPPKHPITVREIMSHTSGLIAASDLPNRNIHNLKDLIAEIAAQPLVWEPGTKFKYNNCGIDTGARLVEVLEGMPYTDFLQKRILDPLELKETTYWPDEALAKRLANTTQMTADKSGRKDHNVGQNISAATRQKFAPGVDVPQPVLDNFGIDMLFVYGQHYGPGAQGLFSTATDISHFCQMLLNGGTWHGKRLLSESAVKQMGSIQTGSADTGADQAYGVGVFVTKNDRQGPAAGSFGHLGARKTVMWVDPKDQLVMVLMVQSFDMTGEQQKALYTPFFKAAVEKYGKAGK